MDSKIKICIAIVMILITILFIWYQRESFQGRSAIQNQFRVAANILRQMSVDNANNQCKMNKNEYNAFIVQLKQQVAQMTNDEHIMACQKDIKLVKSLHNVATQEITNITPKASANTNYPKTQGIANSRHLVSEAFNGLDNKNNKLDKQSNTNMDQLDKLADAFENIGYLVRQKVCTAGKLDADKLVAYITSIRNKACKGPSKNLTIAIADEFANYAEGYTPNQVLQYEHKDLIDNHSEFTTDAAMVRAKGQTNQGPSGPSKVSLYNLDDDKLHQQIYGLNWINTEMYPTNDYTENSLWTDQVDSCRNKDFSHYQFEDGMNMG